MNLMANAHRFRPIPLSIPRQSLSVMSGSDTISGPALVELPHTTVAVAPGQALRLDAFGSMILAISTEAEEIAA